MCKMHPCFPNTKINEFQSKHAWWIRKQTSTNVKVTLHLRLVAVTGAGPCGGTNPIIWLPDPETKISLDLYKTDTPWWRWLHDECWRNGTIVLLLTKISCSFSKDHCTMYNYLLQTYFVIRSHYIVPAITH